MAEESTKKRGRLAAAVIAGSTLAFGSFAMGVPAALADEGDSRVETKVETQAENTLAADSVDDAENEEAGVDSTATPDAAETSEHTSSADDNKAVAEEPTEEESVASGEPTADEEDVPSEEPLETESETVAQDNNIAVQQDTWPEISLDRSLALPGEIVNVTGTGFYEGEGESANIYLHAEGDNFAETPSLANTQSNEDGAISTAVTIPDKIEHGEYIITAHGENSGVTPTVNLTVGDADDVKLDPTIELWPTEGQVGDEIAFHGDGFYPGSSVEVSMSLSGDDLEFDLGIFNVDGTGTLIDPEFVVPDNAVPGTYVFWVTDEASNINQQYNFTVLDDQGNLAREVLLYPGAGAAGDSVNLIGQNFTANGEVELTLVPVDDGEPLEVGTITADDNGSLDEDITIPEDAANGKYTLDAHDVVYDRTVSADFTVTAATMRVEPKEIAFDNFVGAPADGAGVTHTVEGLTPNADIEYSVGTAVSPTDLGGSAQTDDEGIATFVIAAPDESIQYSGEFTTQVRYAGEDDILVSESFTVINDDDGEVTEPTLNADRDQITLEDFVGAAEDEPGVHFTVEGLEAGTEINYAVEASGNLEDLDGSTSVSDDGVAGFFIHGFDSVSDPTVYLGDYSVTATYVDEAGETQELGPETFSVVEDGPLVELSASQAYPGDDITVSGHGFSANAELEISINPTLAELTADDNGAFSTEVTIPEDMAPGHYDITVDSQNADEWALQTIEILDPADQVVDPALTIDPERITLEKFVGEPEDGAGVAHVVEGLEPGAEITYLIASPEYVNDYESRATADENGVAQFVIHGYDVANPSVYLGEYRTVVTYIEEDGDTAALNGDFMVVDGGGSTGGSGDSDDSDDAGSSSPADLNGYDGLAQTGATGMQLGFLAGGLLLLGAAFVAFANRARLFGRKN